MAYFAKAQDLQDDQMMEEAENMLLVALADKSPRGRAVLHSVHNQLGKLHAGQQRRPAPIQEFEIKCHEY